MPDTILVTLEHPFGGTYAPDMAYYRIKRDDLHAAAMANVADRDNVLLSSEAAETIIQDANPRKLSDWRKGWPVTIRLDRWIAFAHYASHEPHS